MNNIVLVGFMGTGKTTVGKQVAARLGFTFIDLDETIEQEEKMTVPEIFAQYGEPYFRRKECETIKKLLMCQNAVIATGGGAVVHDNNLDLLRQIGRVICLTAEPSTILRRVSQRTNRPLLACDDQEKRIVTLLEQRQKYYCQADSMVSTDSLSVKEVVEQIVCCRQSEEFQRVHLDLAEKSYDIEIVADSWELLREWLAKQKFSRRALLVSDDIVGPLYGETVCQILADGGLDVERCYFPSGEASKCLTEANRIFTKAIQSGLDRQSLIVALGGGVTGDMAGFVAATYLRGVPFLQIPTSLLAQVDSSVGGKVAVDHELGKNLIGAFYQPRHVYMNLAVLDTLEPRQFQAGMAEIIKYGLLADQELFEYLESHSAEILALDKTALAFLVRRCCEIKGTFVMADAGEHSIRLALNLGHTIGHAVEAASHFRYLHGEAIAIGLVGSCYLSEQLFGLSHEITERVVNLLAVYGLPDKATGVERSVVEDYLLRDKKSVDHHIRWILLKEIGDWEVHSAVPEERVAAVLTKLLAK